MLQAKPATVNMQGNQFFSELLLFTMGPMLLQHSSRWHKTPGEQPNRARDYLYFQCGCLGDIFHPECANRHRGEDRLGMTRSDYTPGEEAESEQQATLFPPRKPGGQPLVTYLPLWLQKSPQAAPPALDQVFKHLSLESGGVYLPTSAAHTETVSIFSCSWSAPGSQ